MKFLVWKLEIREVHGQKYNHKQQEQQPSERERERNGEKERKQISVELFPDM